VITDDLSGLFGGGPAGLRFRQGTVLTWNPSTGENTVDLAGGTLTNVPIINTAEAVALKPGHVVGMLGQGRTWFILGRVTPPNDPNFAGASLAFGSAGAQVLNYSVSTSSVIKATSDELVVPDWADEAVVLVTGTGCVVNSNAAAQSVALEVGVEGSSGGGSWFDVQPGRIGGYSATNRNLFTGLSGGEVLQVQGAVIGTAAFAANPSNALFVHAIAIYKSNI
jgi:hypothetical protein